MLSSSSLSFIFVAGALAAAPAPAAPAPTSQALFAPNFPVVAYQVAAAADATTYLVACTAGSDTKTCNFEQPYTLVQGPSTAAFTMSIPGQGAATVGCDLDAQTSMACVATGPSGPAKTVTAKTTVTGVAAETHFRAINIVTATADLLTYPTHSTTAKPSTAHPTTHNATTSAVRTSSASNSTSAYPTSAAPTGSAPATSAPAPSSSTIPNAGLLSASANVGGVLGVAAAVGAFFLAGAL